MKELSLHLLDVAKNSTAAGARNVSITLEEGADGWLAVTIADDGRGMSPEFLAQAADPFTTTRTTRKVGLGLPLLFRLFGQLHHIALALGLLLYFGFNRGRRAAVPLLES